MKRSLKKLLSVCAVIFAAAAIPLTVYAYLQSEPKQANKFVIGEDKASVTEVFTEPSTMQMNNTFEKEVMVKNTGTSEQFVRVYLDFSDSRVRGKSTIVYTKDNAKAEEVWSGFLSNLPENWTYVSETDTDGALLGGYFYYTEKLQPKEQTTALIEGIKTDFRADNNDSNIDRITDFDIIVYTESVQTTEIDSDGTVYDDWKSAWKSFLENNTAATS